MAEPEEDLEEEPKKASKLPMIIGLVLALVGGGGGFFAVYSGMILGSDDAHVEKVDMGDIAEPLPDIAFVEVEPLIVSVGAPSQKQHLRFRSQLEVATQYQADVQLLLPRVVDVLNSYLRALDLTDLDDPAALVRLRSQMLRRVQLVTGEGRINDLLIMEFVLN